MNIFNITFILMLIAVVHGAATTKAPKTTTTTTTVSPAQASFQRMCMSNCMADGNPSCAGYKCLSKDRPSCCNPVPGSCTDIIGPYVYKCVSQCENDKDYTKFYNYCCNSSVNGNCTAAFQKLGKLPYSGGLKKLCCT